MWHALVALVLAITITQSCGFKISRQISLGRSQWRLHLQQSLPCCQEPLFSFGVCADIQYVDAPNGFNFQNTKVRRYRQSLDIFKAAVESWKTLPSPPAFAIILGDIVDGKARATNQEKQCLEKVLSVTQDAVSVIPFNYVFGNHEHYSFSRKELHERVLNNRGDCSDSKLYYSFRPEMEDGKTRDDWKFICLDAYDMSLIGPSSPQTLEDARALLAKMNPNDLSKSGGWFDGLSRENYRYVPYNGGLSKEQIRWFRDELRASSECGQKVVVFCHQPIHAPKKPQSVLWNAEEVKAAIRECGSSCVVGWLAGHDHDGQYEAEEIVVSQGAGLVRVMHHLVPPAPIEAQEGATAAYGYIEVHPDRLRLKWTGREPHEKHGIDWSNTRDMLFERDRRP
jgi:manganese-dependent ADP-ribose/CDP-alcohol diphosphatase